MNQYTSGRNTNDSVLRFSSNSSAHPFEIDTPLVSLYFDILSTQINPVDPDTPKVYLNGTPCSFKIIPPIISGINNYINNQEEMFKVFPNPTAGMVTIEMPSNTNLQIVTVIACNVLVADDYKNNKSLQLNLNSFPDGVYFIKTWNDNFFFNKKAHAKKTLIFILIADLFLA